MILKKIKLTNFCGYEDSEFEFERPIALFFGPNGIGKSTVLKAIQLVSNPKALDGRLLGNDTYLRPFIRDRDYIPYADAVLEKDKEKMVIDATFLDYNGKSYNVVLDDSGFIKNDLPDRHGSYSLSLSADNPMNWSKFQIIDTYAEKFIDIAETIYGYKVDLDSEVKDNLSDKGGVLSSLFYKDLIIYKGQYKIHFSRMSDGEKKIATLIRELCNPDNTDNKGIILIDNVEMHIYFKRHEKVLKKLQECFPDKQIIVTTHSKTMIDYGNESNFIQNFDLENYRLDYKMFDSQ